MTDLAVSPSLLQPTPAAPVATARMRETAQAFEASFLAQMLKPMFEGLKTDGAFGVASGFRRRYASIRVSSGRSSADS